MAKSNKKIINYVFLGIVLVGLVLAIVGMFVGQVVHQYDKLTETVKENFALFDSTKWGTQKVGDGLLSTTVELPSNALGIVGFIVAVVGLATLVVTGVLENCLKKSGLLITILRIAGVALALVGAILAFVSGFTMANAYYGEDGKEAANKLNVFYTIGVGPILGFVGGLIGAVAGALPLLKPFKA